MTNNTFTDDLKPGDGVTLCGWSDRNAYTVIARTPKTATIRRDRAKLLNGMNSDAPDKLVSYPGRTPEGLRHTLRAGSGTPTRRTRRARRW